MIVTQLVSTVVLTAKNMVLFFTSKLNTNVSKKLFSDIKIMRFVDSGNVPKSTQLSADYYQVHDKENQ